MALFNHLFPYTNLHDINLDWIISIIKSIDPAVIRALQELTPDIIAQVNQKVAEAQAAAIAAQSSASEANTARDEAVKEATEAAADAALANANAVRAEAAKTAIENSLNVVSAEVVPVDEITVFDNRIAKSGKIAMLSLRGQLTTLSGSGDLYTKIATLPDGFSASGAFLSILFVNNNPHAVKVEGNDISIESETITSNAYFQIYDFTFPIV